MPVPGLKSTDTTGVYLGLLRIVRPFAFSFPAPPGSDEYFLRQPFSSLVDEWFYSARAQRIRQPAGLFQRAWSGAGPSGLSPNEVVLNEPAVAGPDTANRAAGILPGRLSEYADIGMRVTGRGEFGGAWTRFEPCDPGAQITCSPSLFPQIKPDLRFGVQVAGTISDRIHVNVDYDQTREFNAANNINVFYQGFADEILQRVEVGDVSIRLPPSRYLTQGIPAGNWGF